MLAVLRKIGLFHWNDLRIPSTDAKNPSYKTLLDAYFENIARNDLPSNEFYVVKVKCKQNVHKIKLDIANVVCRVGFITQSYIQDSTFYRTRQRLKFNYLRKNLHTRGLVGFLMHPIEIKPTFILHHVIYTKIHLFAMGNFSCTNGANIPQSKKSFCCWTERIRNHRTDLWRFAMRDILLRRFWRYFPFVTKELQTLICPNFFKNTRIDGLDKVVWQ